MSDASLSSILKGIKGRSELESITIFNNEIGPKSCRQLELIIRQKTSLKHTDLDSDHSHECDAHASNLNPP